MKHCFFDCTTFLCPLSKECFTLNKNYYYPKPLNVYQCHLSPTEKALYRLSGVVYDPFQPVLACSRSIYFQQATMSQSILTGKFTTNHGLN